MSRVIKFRSWVEHEDKISGKNNYSYMQENPEFQGSINAIFATSGKEPLNIYGCKVTYMQFTGLHDKNGVEIFEGDVWQWSENRKHVVEFDVERAGWFPFADDDGCGCCADQVYDPEGGEVIGNIYQHPHLLEGS